LGALAAFRVNHQPFTRMQSANPPLQLAFGTGLPDEVTDGRPAPFDVRFQVMSWPATRSAIPVPSNTSPPAATGAAVNTEGDQQARLETNQQPPETVHHDGDGDITPGLAPVSVPVPAPVSAVDRSAPTEAAAPDTKPATAEATPADTVTTAKADDTAAVEPNPGPTASPDKDKAAKPNPSPVTAASAEKAAPRHVVKLHRKRKSQPAAAAASQNFASPIAQFQRQRFAQETPPGAGQTPQPVKHPIAKRHRSAKKAAARAPGAEQTASSGTSRQGV
jgi:hypothetical protein